MFSAVPSRPHGLELAQRVAAPVLRLGGIRSAHVPTELGRLHALVARGRGPLPPVVLMHGLGAAANNFVPLMVALQPHVQSIVAVDMPGHGMSPGTLRPVELEEIFDALRTAVDALCGMPFSLVGNSLGGAMAIRYASAFPQRVRSLALLSPAGAQLDAAALAQVTSAFDIHTPKAARAFLERVYHRPPWYSALVAHDVLAITRAPAVRAVLEQAERAGGIAPEELASLPMPILLWWGESERIFPREALQYFKDHLPPHALVERPAGVGHCPHVEAPRRTAQRLAAHWRGAQRNR